MAALKLRKVLSLPGTLESNTLYLVPNTTNNSFTMTLTTAAGAVGYTSKVRNTFPSGGSDGNGHQLWLWGDNADGRLGDNTINDRSSPIQTVSGGSNWSQVSAGDNHIAAIKTDRSLWLWGYNIYGYLGDNTITHRSSPVQTVSGGTNWSQVSAGDNHTAAIKTDGSLWLWGNNTYGRLGDNAITSRSSPIQTISGGTNWSQVAAGTSYTAAIKTDGSLWLWGFNASGHLGDNTIAPRSSPIQTISGGTNWSQVSAGSHIAAIKTDGSLWLWGYNFYGHLGDNTTSHRSSPIQTISGGTNWSQVSAGNFYTAAIKTDGSLWLWGYNSNGQLGDNTITTCSSPVQTVSGGTNWSQVSAGYNHTAAIKTDGRLWVWGRNTVGHLGDNTILNRSSPVQTVSGGTDWISVEASAGTTAALKSI